MKSAAHGSGLTLSDRILFKSDRQKDPWRLSTSKRRLSYRFTTPWHQQFGGQCEFINLVFFGVLIVTTTLVSSALKVVFAVRSQNTMHKLVMYPLVVISIVAAVFLFDMRTYVPDLWRYAWWRLTSPVSEVGAVTSEDAVIHYRVSGQGEPLVLLHGGLSSSLDWYAQLPELSRHFQVISIDSRGHGQSTLGHQDYSYRLLADDVIAVLDELDIVSTDVAGWSDGGNTALMLALHYSTRIKRVIAISANAHSDGLTPEAADVIDGIDPERPSLFFKALYVIQSPHPSRLIKLRREVLAMWKSGPIFSCKELSTISTPVLLMIGENDDVALSHAQEMQNCMRQAKLEVLAAVGHSVPQSAPERVLGIMQRFLLEQ